MRSEADTPIEERYLRLESKVSPTSMTLIKSGLPSVLPPATKVFFVQYAYADLPFTKQFDVVFPKGRPQDGVRCKCRVIAATDQISRPLLEIPHGWKTICAVHFSGDIPELIQQLPEVDAWYEHREWVCLCDEETWIHLKRQAG